MDGPEVSFGGAAFLFEGAVLPRVSGRGSGQDVLAEKPFSEGAFPCGPVCTESIYWTSFPEPDLEARPGILRRFPIPHTRTHSSEKGIL